MFFNISVRKQIHIRLEKNIKGPKNNPKQNDKQRVSIDLYNKYRDENEIKDEEKDEETEEDEIEESKNEQISKVKTSMNAKEKNNKLKMIYWRTSMI